MPRGTLPRCIARACPRPLRRSPQLPVLPDRPKQCSAPRNPCFGIQIPLLKFVENFLKSKLDPFSVSDTNLGSNLRAITSTPIIGVQKSPIILQTLCGDPSYHTIAITWWCVWLERNRRRFEENKLDAGNLFESIRSILSNWVSFPPTC